jgi:hypothetical protein
MSIFSLQSLKTIFHLLYSRRYKSLILLTFVCIILSCFSVLAYCQNPSTVLGISVNMNTRPSSTLSEWIEKRETIECIISNTSERVITARIQTMIFKDSILVAQTRFEQMPVLSFAPVTTSLRAENIILPESMEFFALVRRTSQRGGLLPPGNYSLCVQLLDANNPLSIRSQKICVQFGIGGFEVPQLVEPMNYSKVNPTRPITFRWKAVTPTPVIPRIARYKVQVFAVAKGQDPLHASMTSKPIFEKFSDSQTPLTLYWLPTKNLLNSLREYVWTVQAVDLEGKTIGEPNGLAEPFIFTIED